MSSEIAAVILHEVMGNNDYAERVLPHLESHFFEFGNQHIFEAINSHFSRYASCPTREQLTIALTEKKGITESEYEDVMERMKGIADNPSYDGDDHWLMDKTQEFIKDRRQHNFMLNAINNLSQNKPLPPSEEYSQILDFSFSESIGHDLFRDWQLLHDHMTDDSERFEFDLPELNRMTNGGVTKKTLNVFLGPTNVGKSMVLCHLAASYVRQGRSVLYVTLEMSKLITAQRITANLLDVPMGQLKTMPCDELGAQMNAIRERCRGKLVIQEYPAASTNVMHFRSLLQDLKRIQKFVPDVILVDYLNLCSAASLGKSARGDLYQTVGTIAAELRGLATEQNVVIWTATQTNRQGYEATEIDLKHMSESYSVNSTADLIFGLNRDDDLPDMMIVKLLKQRNEGISGSHKAVFSVDSSRMKIFEIDPAEQVKKALTAMPKKNSHTFAAQVNSRKPQCPFDDDDDVSEAV
jgi:replicative DNA helicase